MTMIQRKFYFPEEMYNQLNLLAKVTKKTITDVLREIVTEGLEKRRRKNQGKSTLALLELAKMAEKEGWGKNAPKDLAKNHDKYLAKILEKDLKRIHDQYR